MRVPRVHAWQYVKWADKSDLDAFWTDAQVKRLFKNHIDSITSRVNIFNGAAQLMNGPCMHMRVPSLPHLYCTAYLGGCKPSCASLPGGY